MTDLMPEVNYTLKVSVLQDHRSLLIDVITLVVKGSTALFHLNSLLCDTATPGLFPLARGTTSTIILSTARMLVATFDKNLLLLRRRSKKNFFNEIFGLHGNI